mmetsp:Transcript_6025/g.17014  ORF Transcript_6025/g.17014 Transcript_6025/m.17014 type:complete len:299 (-) Transcript_6025:1393-2289(-)
MLIRLSTPASMNGVSDSIWTPIISLSMPWSMSPTISGSRPLGFSSTTALAAGVSGAASWTGAICIIISPCPAVAVFIFEMSVWARASSCLSPASSAIASACSAASSDSWIRPRMCSVWAFRFMAVPSPVLWSHERYMFAASSAPSSTSLNLVLIMFTSASAYVAFALRYMLSIAPVIFVAEIAAFSALLIASWKIRDSREAPSSASLVSTAKWAWTTNKRMLTSKSFSPTFTLSTCASWASFDPSSGAFLEMLMLASVYITCTSILVLFSSWNFACASLTQRSASSNWPACWNAAPPA